MGFVLEGEGVCGASFENIVFGGRGGFSPKKKGGGRGEETGRGREGKRGEGRERRRGIIGMCVCVYV